MAGRGYYLLISIEQKTPVAAELNAARVTVKNCTATRPVKSQGENGRINASFLNKLGDNLDELHNRIGIKLKTALDVSISGTFSDGEGKVRGRKFYQTTDAQAQQIALQEAAKWADEVARDLTKGR